MSDPKDTATCYRCQMRLPERLVRYVIGPRAGTDALCAACDPERRNDPERTEVIALRKARWQR